MPVAICLWRRSLLPPPSYFNTKAKCPRHFPSIQQKGPCHQKNLMSFIFNFYGPSLRCREPNTSCLSCIIKCPNTESSLLKDTHTHKDEEQNRVSVMSSCNSHKFCIFFDVITGAQTISCLRKELWVCEKCSATPGMKECIQIYLNVDFFLFRW